MNLTDLLVQVKHEMGIKWEFSVVMLSFALLMARILPVILFTPMIGGEMSPCTDSAASPLRPWFDSMRPTPASAVHRRAQPGLSSAIAVAADR